MPIRITWLRCHCSGRDAHERRIAAEHLSQRSRPVPGLMRNNRPDPGGISVDRPHIEKLSGAELGWTSLLVPEEAGGGSISGSGVMDLTLVAHEFGRRRDPGEVLVAQRADDHVQTLESP